MTCIFSMTEVTSGTAAAAAIGGSAETVVAGNYVQAMPQQGGERGDGRSPAKDESEMFGDGVLIDRLRRLCTSVVAIS